MTEAETSTRIEIILPLAYENGQLIEPSKFFETRAELVKHFGGCTGLTTTTGVWRNPSTGNIVEDIVSGFYVIASDTQETREFLRNYKEVLKERFDQDEIMITCHPVEVI